MESFFNCTATLMTLQLQELALVSMQDFTDLIAQPPVSKIQSYQYSLTNLFSVLWEWIIITFTSERSESIPITLNCFKKDLVSTYMCRIYYYYYISEVSGNKWKFPSLGNLGHDDWGRLLQTMLFLLEEGPDTGEQSGNLHILLLGSFLHDSRAPLLYTSSFFWPLDPIVDTNKSSWEWLLSFLVQRLLGLTV